MPWIFSSLRTWAVGWAPLDSHSRTRSSSTLIVDGSVCALYCPRISITRPSRGERWSAATTRQIGSFLPPTRVSLSRTAKTNLLVDKRRVRLAALPHHRPEIGHAAARNLLHDLAHLAELFDQLIDRRDVRPGPVGDPQPARALDQLRPPALLRRHRQDDRLDAVELTLVDLEALHLRADAGQHPEQVRERPHLADLLELREEVLERELVGADLALQLGRLVLAELLLGLLDQRHDVAHAEDPLRHAVRVEALEVLELLAGGGEQDRLARDRLDRQGGAAACVAVELGHHDAVEVDGLRELLRDVDGVLAGHGVDHEQDRVRLDRLADVHELGHQRLVDVQAAARVDDQHVLAVARGLPERPGGDLDRVLVRALLVDRGADLAADRDELVDGGRAVDVAGGDGDRG